jgi:hypothetical protein
MLFNMTFAPHHQIGDAHSMCNPIAYDQTLIPTPTVVKLYIFFPMTKK